MCWNETYEGAWENNYMDVLSVREKGWREGVRGEMERYK